MSALALAALLLLASCGGEPAPPEPAAVSTTLPPNAGPAPEPRPFETLEEVASAIGCTDLEDLGNGGNTGLRTQGVCYVGVHNVDVYLTSERKPWERIAQQFPSVFGPQWIVVTPTGPDAARYVQGRIGGRVVLPPG